MNEVKKQKIAVGMSGGVDSSVAAALLTDQGYDVVGIFLKFWSDPTYKGEKAVSNKCCSVESMHDARRVAQKIGIDLITLNLSDRFKEYIVDSFLEEYEAGNTPNPCVKCNQFVKTGYFLEKARELGCEYIATGHYVRRIENQDGTVDLAVPTDLNKDQTYFLYRLDQDTAKHTLFPLGGYTKDQTRELAKKFGLPTYSKQDSQEICFVADQGHNNFLKKWLTMREGDIVSTEGMVLGTHQGLSLYTMGQRKGLNLSQGPWYVVDKNLKENQLVVTNDETHPGLFTKEMFIYDVNWVNREPDANKMYRVKLRYRHEPAMATVERVGTDLYKITYDEGQRAVTPGQSAVVYDGDVMMGGGIIRLNK